MDLNLEDIMDSNNSNKRKRDYVTFNGSNILEDGSVPLLSKKIQRARLYKQYNEGPYEVIINNKINLFVVGKIMQNHHKDIDHIKRSGKNLTDICNIYIATNNLIESQYSFCSIK